MLKRLIPLPIRRAVKWLRYAVLDMRDGLKGDRPPRVPARRHSFIGCDDFIGVGNAFARRLKADGLLPVHHMLDVGSGLGRMARPLADYFTEGSYTGLEIVPAGVRWCQEHYKGEPNITFIHADVASQRYNPGGAARAHHYRFPLDDNSVDYVLLASVFTHMFAADIENYLSEVKRVMRPGGRCLITWYILGGTMNTPKMDFDYNVDEMSKTTVASNPEAAMAFDEIWLRATYAKAGLHMDTIQRGGWRGIDSPNFQDMIWAQK